MTAAFILATVSALRAAQTPEAAQAVLLNAIDQGLPIVLAADADIECRPVPDAPGYMVSSYGHVISFIKRRPRVLKPCRAKGYLSVEMHPGPGIKVKRTVHLIVASAFLGPKPTPDSQIRHLDGNKDNNHVSNLAWGTASENAYDNVRHGVHANATKTHCPAGHRYTAANTYVGPSEGRRRCRTCRNLQNSPMRAGLLRLQYISDPDEARAVIESLDVSKRVRALIRREWQAEAARSVTVLEAS